MTVQRSERVKKPNGATELAWVTKHLNVACRISQTGLAANTQTDTTNDIDYSSKLFLSPLVEIKHGDKLAVTREGLTREYTAGEPFIYPTHQEINLERDVKS
ncbi:ABC transporter ATP-binding protein [Paenibacillus sp. ACRRY]|uniref:ABC transporter ATP-binding protein n=1 Tax=Paenibacillus sp. ACRRY TaxID=2918208 RepID=UPI001EF5B2FE|nr:ABC transporter ATP-binding protein [Paenibacillus sp. ACRRY]MCG7385101.1 ABC transporter ATP-binding protein [Paenibacillus sp. ACRRY]